MAWTDTARCMFCDREIPIFRKFGGGQFCSAAHEESYRQQQDELAVEVLHRTHDALKAYRPVGSSIEDILGPSAPRPVLTERFPEEVPPPVQSIPTVPAESREFDVAAAAFLPQWEQTPAQSAHRDEPPAPTDWSALQFGESQAKLHLPRVGWARRILSFLWP